MVELASMAEDDFPTYLKNSIELYAGEKTRSGDWSEMESRSLSERTFNSLLPDGMATKDHYFFSIVDENSGLKVGVIWVGIGDASPAKGAWV